MSGTPATSAVIVSPGVLSEFAHVSHRLRQLRDALLEGKVLFR